MSCPIVLISHDLGKTATQEVIELFISCYRVLVFTRFFVLAVYNKQLRFAPFKSRFSKLAANVIFPNKANSLLIAWPVQKDHLYWNVFVNHSCQRTVQISFDCLRKWVECGYCHPYPTTAVWPWTTHDIGFHGAIALEVNPSHSTCGGVLPDLGCQQAYAICWNIWTGHDQLDMDIFWFGK